MVRPFGSRNRIILLACTSCRHEYPATRQNQRFCTTRCSQRAKRLRYKIEGRCQRCNQRQRRAGYSQCLPCSKKDKASHARRYRFLTAASLCVICGNSTEVAGVRCNACSEAVRNAASIQNADREIDWQMSIPYRRKIFAVEAAEILGVDQSTISRLGQSGALPKHQRQGRRWRGIYFYENDVLTLAKIRQKKA